MHEALATAIEAAAAGGPPLLVLFPDPAAQSLESVARRLHAHAAPAEPSVRSVDACVGPSAAGVGAGKGAANARAAADRGTSVARAGAGIGARDPCASAGVETSAAKADADAEAGMGRGAKSRGLHAAAEPGTDPAYTLLVLDGTWQQGREMWAACAPAVLPIATPVCLPAGACGALHLRLKMEPGQGCTSTCEAVAEALRLLEPGGDGLAAALLAPLELLSAHQARWDPAVAARRQGAGGMYTEGKGRFNVGASVAAAAAAGGLGVEVREGVSVPGSVPLPTPATL